MLNRWLKKSKNIWSDGKTDIVKYKMASKWFYLRYESGYKDCSNYKSFKTLKEAKNATNPRNTQAL